VIADTGSTDNTIAVARECRATVVRCRWTEQVMSCDEFACHLLGRERTLLQATAIAYEIKRELRTVGITLRCSVGLAPNRLLAKIAGDMQKPDGLMIFERRYLPQALYSLELANIPGIGNRMRSAFLTKALPPCAPTLLSHTRADAHNMGRRLRGSTVALAAR
jgi:nucleotidyltransferase/DNA polymerase involved in DNA repair